MAISSGSPKLAETIILQFRNGDPAALLTYQKICRAIDSIERWLPEGVTEFIEQFINISSLLDVKCRQLVEKLASIKWHIVPVAIRERYVDMLQKLAVQHVCHTEVILCSFTSHMVPAIRPVLATKCDDVAKASSSSETENELLLSVEEQDDIYEMAHGAVKFVLRCFPMSVRLLEKALRRSFPFFKTHALRYNAYVKNLLLLYVYAVDIRGDIWKMLLESFVLLDSTISKKSVKCGDADNVGNAEEMFGVFFMDEDSSFIHGKVAGEHELERKLDYCMFYVLSFVAKAHCQEIPTSADALLVPVHCSFTSREGMYLSFRAAFESNVLLATGLKSVPFLMFYFISLDEKYLINFSEWLWDFIIVPSQSPSDWKKAHAAACYLGNLLSKAKFVDVSFCYMWMENFVNWCTKYVNETIGGTAGASAGTLRHGTFYAVCQALLVTFAYRYSEIVANDGLERVRRWGLGHIIHCPLQPLRYISPTVASNFAAISRSLQLVYCSHMLPQLYDNVNMPFEPFFPFEYYGLARSSSIISSLVLRFCPLKEDVADIQWHRHGSRSNPMSFQEAGSLEFLEDLKRDKDLTSEGSSVWPGIDAMLISSSSLMDAT